MSKKRSRVIGIAMLVLGAGFLLFALGHPECSVPWDNAITYTVYLAYLALTPVLLAAPFGAKK